MGCLYIVEALTSQWLTEMLEVLDLYFTVGYLKNNLIFSRIRYEENVSVIFGACVSNI